MVFYSISLVLVISIQHIWELSYHHSYGKKTIITSSFVTNAFIFFPCLQLYIIKQGLQMILYSLFIFFHYFFVGSKLNLITAFEVFFFFLLCPFLLLLLLLFLQKNILLYMQYVSWRSSILCYAWLNEIFTFFFFLGFQFL